MNNYKIFKIHLMKILKQKKMTIRQRYRFSLGKMKTQNLI